MSPHQALRADLIQFATERTEAIVERFLPGFRIPTASTYSLWAAFYGNKRFCFVSSRKGVVDSSKCGIVTV